MDSSNVTLSTSLNQIDNNLTVTSDLVSDTTIDTTLSQTETSLNAGIVSDSTVVDTSLSGTGTPIVTNKHSELLGRYDNDQHPISAITGLESELLKLSNAITGDSDERITDISTEYYISSSPTTLENGKWINTSPGWRDGVYIWSRIKYTYKNGTIKYSAPVCYTGTKGESTYVHYAYANSFDGTEDFSLTNENNTQYLYLGTLTDFNQSASTDPSDYTWTYIRGESGEDAILLTIDSSNGSMFKNSNISTSLTVTITVGGESVSSSERLHEVFGADAKLIWKCRKFKAEESEEILADDPRLSDNGFIFTVSPDDVDTKMVFFCELDF